MWASPHASTRSPVVGVDDRSKAITAAAPRTKPNGESAMRPYRTAKLAGPRLRLGFEERDRVTPGPGHCLLPVCRKRHVVS